MLVDKLLEIDANAVNGSVFPHEDHYWLVGNDSYNRRETYLYVLSADFQLTGERTFLARHFEDHRVVSNQETCHVWCNFSGGAAMHYGELDSSSRSLHATKIRPEKFVPKRLEKNWCPFVRNGEIFLVYSFYPQLVILKKRGRNIHEKNFSEKSSYFHSWVAENLDLSKVKHVGGGSNLVKYRGFYVGTFHVKSLGVEYSSYMVFLTPDHVVKSIVEIDYGETVFEGERLARLKKELDEDETGLFWAAGYRRKLKKVAFTTGIFLKNGKFHISLGINDLVTKLALIGVEKIDDIIDDISRRPSPSPLWIVPSVWQGS